MPSNVGGERKTSRIKSVANFIVAGALGACSIQAEARDVSVPTPEPSSTFFPTETWIPTPRTTATAFVPATPTPNYDELQALKPFGIEGEVVMGEEGSPQLAVNLPVGYGEHSGKIVIAEERYGQWRLVPFSMMQTPKSIIQLFKSHDYDNYLYSLDSGIIKNSLLYSVISGQLVGMSLDIDETNRTELIWIIAYRGRVFKLKPDVFVVGESNGARRTEYDTDHLTLETVANMINLLGRQYPTGNAIFSIMLNSLAAGVTYPEVEQICRIYGEKFDQMCRHLAQGQDRLVESRDEMERLVNNYEFLPKDGQMSEKNVWWDNNLFKPFPEGVITSAIVVLTEG